MQEFSFFDFSILGFGGLFCIVWAAGLSLQLPNPIKWIAVSFVGTSGIRLIWEAYTLSNAVFSFPEIYSLPIPFLYFVGPSILLYYETLSGNNVWNLKYKHLIPIGISFLPLLYWFSLSSEQRILLIISILNGNWEFPNSIFILWVLGPKISILVYAIFIGSRKSGEGALAISLLPEKVKVFSITLLIYILLMILTDIIGYMSGKRYLYQISAWSHSFAVIYVYLYSKLNPYSMLEISGAIKTARYSQSKINRINHQIALDKLKHLMSNEAYYADEDLRLSSLAEAMKMSPHQLSELINAHFQMSFIHFVNSYRIIMACKMLEEEERTILSIAYAVGFNSKSAFNRVFREFMSDSPSTYRKNPSFFEQVKKHLIKKIQPEGADTYIRKSQVID